MTAGKSGDNKKQKRSSLIQRNFLQEWQYLHSMSIVKGCFSVSIAMQEPRPAKGDQEDMVMKQLMPIHTLNGSTFKDMKD
jgi:hypothetical protein